MNSTTWTWFAIGYQCGFAYIVALIIYQLGSIFTGNANVFGIIAALICLALICWFLFRKQPDFDKKLKAGANNN